MIKLIVLAVVVCAVSAGWGGRSWGERGWEGGRGGGEHEIGRGGWGGGGGGGGHGWEHGRRHDYYSPPKYEYNYGVEDDHTGDHKHQHEERHDDHVRGEYSFLEADGTRRIVKYEADDKNGFNAKVIREGHAWHPVGWERRGDEHGERRWGKGRW